MGTIAFKLAFAALLVATAFAATYASSAAAFSDHDFRTVAALGAAVNAVALLAALLLSLLRRKHVVNAALALVVLASVGSAYLVHTDLYLAGNRAVLVLLCAMSLTGLFVALRVIDESRWGGAALSAAALLGFWMVGGGNLLADRTPASVGAPVRGDVSNIRHVHFQRTPNLYFISFESMIPRALLRKHLGVETTGFHELFEKKMRRFSNLFAAAVGTTNSLNSMLALEAQVYSSQKIAMKKKGKAPNPYLFSGWNPSPLLDILHRNGYETTSIYMDSYLGKRKGPYIGNHVTFVDDTVCTKLDPGLRAISFWGYCRWFDRASGWGRYGGQTPVVEEIVKAVAKDGPQFVMAHLYTPGHVPKSFRYDDADQLEAFRNDYVEKSEEAADYLKRIVWHLEDNDPEAILLVYGDHGPRLSQGLKFEDDPAFVLQDQYGVIGGVWPRDACAAELDEVSVKGWTTTVQAVHAILTCLSGGERALVKPRKYYPLYGRIPPTREVVLDFGEFSYE